VDAKAPVQRQSMLFAAVGLTAAAALCMAVGLWDLGQRQTTAPKVVAVEKAVLSDALNDAPWISSGGEGPVVWLVTAADCPACRRFEKQVLPGLLDKGVQARVILVAPREHEVAPPDAQVIAAVAKQRDWVTLQAWMTSGKPDQSPIGAADREGYLEWGRASYDRLAVTLKRNGMDLAVPALFWRVGPEWRASVKPDGRTLAFLRDDVAAAAASDN
jgi:hypothetical protein